MISEIWTQAVGEIVNGRYRIGTLLNSNGVEAAYLSDDDVVIKLRSADSPGAEALLERWRAISELSHPHVARLLEAGYCEIGQEPCVYAVTEKADVSLADVLEERALSDEETREMVTPALDALSYIHQRGYVHGAVQPSNFLAIGDRLKLSSDNLLPAEGASVVITDSYSAPEWDSHQSPAGNIWSLGMTILQALTRRLVLDHQTFRKLPEPFADVILHCLERDPRKRWTPDEIAVRLRAETARPKAVAEVKRNVPGVQVVRSSTPLSALEVSRLWARKWTLALGAITFAAVLFFIIIYKPRLAPATVQAEAGPAVAASSEGPKSAPEPVAPVTTHRAITAPEPDRVRESAKAVPDRRASSWYVVVATYGQRSGAEKRAREISNKWTEFKAQVFEPDGSNSHLVVIGSNLSEQAADALRKKARFAGLARDVYIKRFSD